MSESPYHLAGHLVAAHVLGVRFGEVRIESGAISDHFLWTVHEAAHDVWTKRVLMVLFAGPAAEVLGVGRENVDATEEEYDRGRALELADDLSDPDAVLQTAEQHARLILLNYWPLVLEVANHLRNGESLDDGEVAGIARRVPPEFGREGEAERGDPAQLVWGLPKRRRRPYDPKIPKEWGLEYGPLPGGIAEFPGYPGAPQVLAVATAWLNQEPHFFYDHPERVLSPELDRMASESTRGPLAQLLGAVAFLQVNGTVGETQEQREDLLASLRKGLRGSPIEPARGRALLDGLSAYEEHLELKMVRARAAERALAEWGYAFDKQERRIKMRDGSRHRPADLFVQLVDDVYDQVAECESPAFRGNRVEYREKIADALSPYFPASILDPASDAPIARALDAISKSRSKLAK